MRYVVIMAGGSGTRLWPLSRQGRPKQLLELFEGRSLLRLAFERLEGVVPPERILVCTGRAYAEDVAHQLPELAGANILGEPEGRDSLNAVAWSAAVVADRDPDGVVAMVTADQVITPVDEFRRSLELAFEVAEARPNALVTLGVVPTSPHTGYGYLHRAEELEGFEGVFRVAEFKEKPARDVAERYLASGGYWWNAGMFVWRAATLLRQLEVLEPATHAAVLDLAAHPDRLDEVFPTLRKTSVDYAVMEPVAAGKASGHVVAVALPVSWRDVGGFASLAEVLDTDDHGNAVEGLAVLTESQRNVVINTAPDRLVAAVGVHGLVIVQTADATLVTTVDNAERVRALVAAVSDATGPRFI